MTLEVGEEQEKKGAWGPGRKRGRPDEGLTPGVLTAVMEQLLPTFSRASAQIWAFHMWFLMERKDKGPSSTFGPTPGRGKGTAANVERRMGTQR